jgi:hypothetical protein
MPRFVSPPAQQECKNAAIEIVDMNMADPFGEKEIQSYGCPTSKRLGAMTTLQIVELDHFREIGSKLPFSARIAERRKAVHGLERCSMASNSADK